MLAVFFKMWFYNSNIFVAGNEMWLKNKRLKNASGKPFSLLLVINEKDRECRILRHIKARYLFDAKF